jgi:transcriptional regulator with XRE-family HTH domain
MPHQNTVGSRIVLARKQLGLTPSQLATRAGVKLKTLEKWESGRSEPRSDKLMRLAGVLQVPLLWLLTGDAPEGADFDPAASETARIAQSLDKALAMQHDLAALLVDVCADVSRLQRDIDGTDDAGRDRAAA